MTLIKSRIRLHAIWELPNSNTRFTKPVNEKFRCIISLAEYYNISLDYLCGLIPHPRPLNQDPKESYKIIINKKI